MTTLLAKALVLDLETTVASPAGTAAIRMIGALRADTGTELELKISLSLPLGEVLQQRLSA